MDTPPTINPPKNDNFRDNNNKKIENKDEYIMNEYKLLVYIEDKYIIFNINKLDSNILLYHYQNKYELKEIINILNLNINLYDNLEKIRELINEAYLNKKLSIYNINNEMNLNLKLTIGFKEYEYLIILNKKELNINEKFEMIINKILLLKKSNNVLINDKFKEIEKLIFDLKDIVNKKMKENEDSINLLKNNIKDNKYLLQNNKKEIEYLKNEILNNRIKSKLCKIKTLSGKIGYGFLMKLYKGENPFYCLISNGNIINEKMIKSKEKLEINYDNENKIIKIELNEKERFILNYKFINIDAIIIEILPKDNINKNYYFLPDLKYIKDYEKLKNKRINIIDYKEEENNITNEIKSINQYEFKYLNKASGISGSPIFIEGSSKVIGINKEGESGNNLIPIIESLKSNLEYVKIKYKNGLYEGFNTNNKYEVNGKFIWENGEYYIGQFLNGLKHGKGTIYYKNKNIKYEGDFVNDKYEGNGKFIWENGEYYIGQFLNGLKHGKGIEYDKNNNIKYEGNFVNDKYEGNGKYIDKNGDGGYYKGQFLNGLKHGKGIEYYKNNNIKYEGDFINDKYEGNGKYIYKNGEYYIGQFLNGLKHGEGIEYYKKEIYSTFIKDKGNRKFIYKNDNNYNQKNSSKAKKHDKQIDYHINKINVKFRIKENKKYKNNNIKYEGDFVNDKYEGNGKYIWEDGEYYIGQFLNGLKHGKGTIYYKNKNIRYKGDFVNDKYEGNGKYIYANGNYYIGQWLNGLKHGKGTLYYKNNSIKYEGDFVNNKYEGNGKYIYESGEYYIGQFLNGLKHGKGIEYDKNNNIKYEGNFDNDNILNKY